MSGRKILIASPGISIGGLGSYITGLASGLAGRGWDVSLLTTDQGIALQDNSFKPDACHDLSGIPLSINKIFTAAGLVNGLSPDILLLNNAPLLHYALPLLKKSVRSVAVLHSDDERFYGNASLFRKRIFRWICPAPGVAKSFANFIPEQCGRAVKVVPHGIDPGIFSPTDIYDKKRHPVVTFVGYMAENKGADLLPGIVSKIASRHNETRFIFVGGGPLSERLDFEFNRLGIGGQCSFRGTMPQTGVADILKQSDIFLLPTRLEGFGLAIAEAMMSGAVPVVSRLSGITDTIVDDGKTGILVNPDDINGFADAVCRLLENPSMHGMMSHSAKNAAGEYFSKDRMLANYEAIFSEQDDRMILKQRGPIGWWSETIMELFDRGIDGNWLKRRFSGLLK